MTKEPHLLLSIDVAVGIVEVINLSFPSICFEWGEDFAPLAYTLNTTGVRIWFWEQFGFVLSLHAYLVRAELELYFLERPPGNSVPESLNAHESIEELHPAILFYDLDIYPVTVTS